MKIFNKFIEFGNFANNRLQKASFCILLFAASVLAQEFNMNNMPPPEASMHYSLGALTKGSSVTVDITIPDNWHVNANVAADEFLKPSSIEIAAQGIHFGEPKWPEPIKEYSEALDLENLVFKGHFQITLPIENVDADYDSLTTQATFHYQACDNSICLAPSQVTFGVGPVGFNKKRASRDDAGNMHGSATSTDANGNANGNAINAPSAAGHQCAERRRECDRRRCRDVHIAFVGTVRRLNSELDAVRAAGAFAKAFQLDQAGWRKPQATARTRDFDNARDSRELLGARRDCRRRQSRRRECRLGHAIPERWIHRVHGRDSERFCHELFWSL